MMYAVSCYIGLHQNGTRLYQPHRSAIMHLFWIFGRKLTVMTGPQWMYSSYPRLMPRVNEAVSPIPVTIYHCLQQILKHKSLIYMFHAQEHQITFATTNKTPIFFTQCWHLPGDGHYIHNTKLENMTSSNGNISPLLAFCEGNSLIKASTLTNGWANNQDASDLRYHHAHDNVTVMAGNLITLIVTGALSQCKDSLFRYGDFHYKDKTILRLSYLCNGHYYIGNTTSLYCDGCQVITKFIMIWCCINILMTVSSIYQQLKRQKTCSHRQGIRHNFEYFDDKCNIEAE